MEKEKTKYDLNLSSLLVSDHIYEMLAYWDKNLICRFANEAYREWFGKTSDEMINKISMQQLFGSSYNQNITYVNNALKGEVQTFEREINDPLSGLKHFLVKYLPDAEHGEVKGFFVHITDITSVKLLEDELSKSNSIINGQNKQLLNFANIVSHNLKSYANNLEGILELFSENNSEEEKKELLYYLKRISKNFSQTINHLNEIVKIQNLSAIKLDELNLHYYIERTIDVLYSKIKSNHATIINNVNPVLTVLANPAFMESIVLNFLTNAIKYSVPERACIVELNAIKLDKEIVLKVKDNGRGINLAKHGDALFGMYRTFHENKDAEGIGLFITKLQVEFIGGHIEVESEENKGTTFSIYFMCA